MESKGQLDILLMFFIEMACIVFFFLVNLSFFLGKRNLMTVKLFTSLHSFFPIFVNIYYNSFTFIILHSTLSKSLHNTDFVQLTQHCELSFSQIYHFHRYISMRCWHFLCFKWLWGYIIIWIILQILGQVFFSLNKKAKNILCPN